jgi:predicted Na+-dependent transporter
MKRKVAFWAFTVEFIILSVLIIVLTYLVTKNPEAILERWTYIGALLFCCCALVATIVWFRYWRKHSSQ